MNLVPPDTSSVATTRVTQSDIARAAGVHNTTVSLALRNSPAIPEHTRSRIRALAEEMGYYPDPALRALVAYRNRRVAQDRRETIAYITDADTRNGWRDVPAERQFHEGALHAAAQFGYQLEHFWLGEPGLSQRRLSNVLFHRGIKGVLVASPRIDSDELRDFDWSHLSAVRISPVPHTPALHRVTEDRAGAVRLAVRRTVALGYRRIGLVVPKAWDDSSDQAWSTGFLVEQGRLPSQHRIPAFVFGATEAPKNARRLESEAAMLVRKLGKWLNEWQPDAIIGSLPLVADALAQLGRSIPQDLGFAELSLNDADPSLAGVCPNSIRVGEVATEMLVGQMQQNVFGTPCVPTVTLVESAWCDGDSLPSRNREPIALDGASSPDGGRPKVLEHVA